MGANVGHFSRANARVVNPQICANEMRSNIYMYKDIKSNIIFNNSKSDYFPCDNGIRQGENHNVTGLLTISQDIENIMNVYMNIFLLLYADDTVLMAETPEDLQKQLNIFHDYCLAWKLKVNIDKTKIACFTNGRLPQNLQFTS